MITVSDGEEGKLHKQNIFYDVLLIIVIREYILGINCFHATIFIWKFLKNELNACLQMVETKKEQHFILFLEVLIHTHTLHLDSDKQQIEIHSPFSGTPPFSSPTTVSYSPFLRVNKTSWAHFTSSF